MDEVGAEVAVAAAAPVAAAAAAPLPVAETSPRIMVSPAAAAAPGAGCPRLSTLCVLSGFAAYM